MNKSTKIRSTIAAAAILALGGVATFSLLSDTSTTNIDVSSATFELSVNGSTNGTYDVDIDATNLAPGDVRSGDIVLTNNSTVPATVTLDKNQLENYNVNVSDGAAEFASVTLAPGASEELELTVGLDATETGSPAAEVLTLTFNANQ
jgi:uncharacterized membrane protein